MKYQLTESVQIEVVAVIPRGFAIDVIPVVADLILLIEHGVVRTKESKILNLKRNNKYILGLVQLAI